MMDIQLKVNDNRGSFFIEKDNRQIAELDFEIKAGVLNAYHTGVRKELEGQGIAAQLVNKMIDYARSNNYQVIPSCPYIEMKFKRNPSEVEDIWYHSTK